METDVSDADVAEYMEQMQAEGLVWSYEVDGLRCGFLPVFPAWNSALTRWNEPRDVPLPPGIAFVAHESKNRWASGTFYWPKGREALQRTVEAPVGPSLGPSKRGKGFRNIDELLKDTPQSDRT